MIRQPMTIIGIAQTDRDSNSLGNGSSAAMRQPINNARAAVFHRLVRVPKSALCSVSMARISPSLHSSCRRSRAHVVVYPLALEWSYVPVVGHAILLILVSIKMPLPLP